MSIIGCDCSLLIEEKDGEKVTDPLDEAETLAGRTKIHPILILTGKLQQAD